MAVGTVLFDIDCTLVSNDLYVRPSGEPVRGSGSSFGYHLVHDQNAKGVIEDVPYPLGPLRLAAIALRSSKCSDEILRAAGTVAFYNGFAALLGYDASPLAQ